MNTLLLVLSLFSSPALALELPYTCRVLIAADDVPVHAGDWQFTTEVDGEGHGGAVKVFQEGAHEIAVQANQQWLSLSWSKSGTKIAEGQFVLGSKDRAANRVAILYNPDGSGDQVSISCDE